MIGIYLLFEFLHLFLLEFLRVNLLGFYFLHDLGGELFLLLSLLLLGEGDPLELAGELLGLLLLQDLLPLLGLRQLLRDRLLIVSASR